jgi:hypothetical protein
MLKKILIGIIILLGTIEAIASDTSTHPAASVNTQVVRYDATTDQLSVHVQDRPLSQVLARISRQSGVEILADPSIDHPVTTSVQNQPLEAVLGDLTRGMNVVMIHDQREVPGQGLKTVLTRVELLPVGQSNRALLRPVLRAGGGVRPYAGNGDPTGSHARRFLNGRRQARRQRHQERAAANTDKAQTQTQTAEPDRKAQHQQKRLDRLNRQLAQAQALAATDPEASQQRIQKINQKMARIQQRQGKTAADSTP